MVVAAHQRVGDPLELVLRRVVEVRLEDVGVAATPVVLRAAGDQHVVVGQDRGVRVAGALLQGRAVLEARVRVLQVDDPGLLAGLLGLADATAADHHVLLVLRGRQQHRAGRLHELGVAEPRDLREPVGVHVPDARLTAHVVRSVARVRTRVEDLAVLHEEQRRVGRELPDLAGVGPLLGLRVEDLVLARHELPDVVEAGDAEDLPVAQGGERRVPAGLLHRVDLDVLLGYGVELEGVPDALEVLLVEGELLGDAVGVLGVGAVQAVHLVVVLRARLVLLPALLRLDVDPAEAGVVAQELAGRFVEDLLRARHEHRVLRDEGLAVLLARELRARGQGDRLVRVLVVDDHQAAGLGDVTLELLVPLRAARDQQIAVGELGVAGAEQVGGRGDLLDGALDRVPDPGVELLRVEVVLVVARPRDEQHLAGAQQRRVDRVLPVLFGEIDDLPLAVRGLVLRLVDCVLVVFLGSEAVEPRPVHPGQREYHRRADRESTGPAAACTVVHSLRPPSPPRAICMVWSDPPTSPFSPGVAAQLGLCCGACAADGCCGMGSGCVRCGPAGSCGCSPAGAAGFFAS